MWCIPEIIEGVGNQRNKEGNQDTPVQDLNSTGPVLLPGFSTLGSTRPTGKLKGGHEGEKQVII